MRIKLIFAVLAFALAGCASDSAVRWAQGQQAYNDTLQTLITYRAPCVPGQMAGAGPEHPLCKIDDGEYRDIEAVRMAADAVLRHLDVAATSGNSNLVASLLTQLDGLLTRLVAARIAAETQDQGPPE